MLGFRWNVWVVGAALSFQSVRSQSVTMMICSFETLCARARPYELLDSCSNDYVFVMVLIWLTAATRQKRRQQPKLIMKML